MKRSPWRFLDAGLTLPSAAYLLLIALMLAAMACFTSFADLRAMLADAACRRVAMFTLATCALSTLLALGLGVPLGFRLARRPPRLRLAWEWLLDVPILLPPMVVGIGLMVLLTRADFLARQAHLPDPDLRHLLYTPAAVVLAQAAVATAFVARMMRAAFLQLPPRPEEVALTLGAPPRTVFWRVILPQTRGAVWQAATLAFARCLGEFGPILILAGTGSRTEVLSSSVYLAFTQGQLDRAISLSFLMVALVLALLLLARLLGPKDAVGGAHD